MFRPICAPRTREREYCDIAIDIYTGCNHGCIYCFVPDLLRKTREKFEQVEPQKDILDIVKRRLDKKQMQNKKVMLCFNCDPYPSQVDTTITREVIRAIKESGNHVQILTKSGERGLRDLDLLDSNDSYGVTISCTKSERIEPNAAPILERLLALNLAHRLKIKTWVSCEPVYEPEGIYKLIKYYDFIDLYRIGKLNYLHSDINWGEFGRECEKLCKMYNRQYYIKEDLRAYMDAVESRQ